MKKAISIIALLLAVLCVFSGCSSSPKAYPDKNIDVTVLFTAGCSADLGVRKLTDIIEKTTDAKFVVNNRTGGGGSVGYQYILNQSEDGYNICWNSTSISTAYHNGNMPEGQDYTAFKAVCGLTIEPSIIAVSADSPYQTFEDFYNDVKARPGEVKVLMGSIGSFDHLCAANFAKAAGLELNACHDNGSVVTPLLGNQVDVSMSIAAEFLPQIQAGSCRALAVIAPERIACLPDVPVLSEFNIDCDLTMYRGISVKAGTSDEAVKWLSEQFIAAAQTDEFKEYAKENGFEILIQETEEFEKYTASADAQVADIMEELGLKAQ